MQVNPSKKWTDYRTIFVRFIIFVAVSIIPRFQSQMSIYYNNPVQIRSGSGSTSKEIDFVICNNCLWLASIYKNMNISSNIKCPICNDNRNLESMSIFESDLEIIKNTVVI